MVLTQLVREGLLDDTNFAVFGVFDGHGEFGELVSGFVRDNLPKYLEKTKSMLTDDPIAALTKGTADLCAALKDTSINRQFSGTTAVYGLRVGRKLYCANIGVPCQIFPLCVASFSLFALSLSLSLSPNPT